MIKFLSSIFISVLLTSNANAQENAPVSKGFTQEQMEFMADENEKVKEAHKDLNIFNRSPLPGLQKGDVRPYGEYENQGYLIFNDGRDFNSHNAKRGFLENLPEGVTPIIYTLNQSPEFIESLKESFGVYLKNPSDLKVKFFTKEGNGFWSRDAIPVPVYMKSGEEKVFTVVDAKYYHDYEPDEEVAELFGAELFSHDYYFEGGNFQANSKGDCIVVNTDATGRVPDSVFTNYYGCERLIRLPFIKGIGHVDESVKFIDENLVITDAEVYESILKEEGFDVVLFPRAQRKYETYLNSVILNDTVYVPVFGRAEEDEAVLQAYRNLGLNPVPMNSYFLSNKGLGSLHCISMVYPKLDEVEL